MPVPRQPASELHQEFGDRVRARRLELGLSQEALAHEASLQRAYIGQVELGMRNVGLENWSDWPGHWKWISVIWLKDFSSSRTAQASSRD